LIAKLQIEVCSILDIEGALRAQSETLCFAQRPRGARARCALDREAACRGALRPPTARLIVTLHIEVRCVRQLRA
jgi:hypothetical protein